MSSEQDSDSHARTVELLTRLLNENDLDALLTAFARGEIGEDRIVTELAVRYQRGIGSAAQALAEHNKAAAQQLGERLRSRIDEFLTTLAVRDTGHPAAHTSQSVASDSFKDRDDGVLRREYVILKALANRNTAMKSMNIFKAVRSVITDAQDEAITAHLGRLVKAGVIQRPRKGYYNSAADSTAHLDSLMSEIEARGLALPALAERFASETD